MPQLHIDGSIPLLQHHPKTVNERVKWILCKRERRNHQYLFPQLRLHLFSNALQCFQKEGHPGLERSEVLVCCRKQDQSMMKNLNPPNDKFQPVMFFRYQLLKQDLCHYQQADKQWAKPIANTQWWKSTYKSHRKGSFCTIFFLWNVIDNQIGSCYSTFSMRQRPRQSKKQGDFEPWIYTTKLAV